MNDSSGYELLDYGRDATGLGRKLERFGEAILDRPAPAAAPFAKTQPKSWRRAVARYDLDLSTGDGLRRGRWTPNEFLGRTWPLSIVVPGLDRPLAVEMKATEFGHLGLFPEQAENWAWLAAQVRAAPQLPNVLNLFAYTGASTLALACAGAAVTHVDAAAGVVTWARRNAALSGLERAPVRWICEDAVKFAQRELKRGRRYDAVVLDPPSYGHGPKGQPWVLSEHFSELLAICRDVMADRGQFLLCTCHSAGVTHGDLGAVVRQTMRGGCATTGDMNLSSANAAPLAAGASCRWLAS